MAAVEMTSPGDPSSDPFDVPRISAFLVVPQKTIETLTASSDGDAVATILAALTGKAREYDDMKAEKLRMDVELEQSSRTANTRIASMKARLENALAETQELRGKVLEAESARATIDSELSNLKNSSSSSGEEVRNLRSRISTLEAEKRETLEALDRKNGVYDRLQEDHNAAQSKLIDTRRQVNELESKLQQVEAAQSSLKLRDQTLKQEIEILKKNNEWLDSELNTKAAEHSKYRRDKSAQVNKLQHDLEEACSKAGMAERNAELVRQRYEEVSRKAEEAQMKVKELNDRIASQEDAFREEIAAAQRLAELWERSANSARKRVTEVETILENERSAQSEEVGRIQAVCDALKEENSHATAKIETLEVQIERLEADLATYAAVQQRSASPAGNRLSFGGPPRTPRRDGTATPERMLFSPAAQAIVQSQKTGVSLTQMYTDYASMKKELETANRRNSRLQESFDELIAELERKAPEIDSMKDELSRAEESITEMSELLQDANIARDEAEKEVNSLKVKNKEFRTESGILRQQLRDLSNQVRFLLSENQHLSQGFSSFSTVDQQRFRALAESGQTLNVIESDTDQLISQRLVVFKNIKELQEKNAELVKMIRELGRRLEAEEERMRLEAEGQKSKEILEMQQVLDRYQDEMKNLQARSESFIKERDMFRRMLQNRGNTAVAPESPLKVSDLGPQMGDSQMSASGGPARIEENKEDYAQLLRDLQQSFDQYRQESATDHNTLRDQSNRLQTEKNELQIQVTRINGQLELANNRYEMLSSNYDLLKNENSELSKRNQYLSELQVKLDLRSQQIEEELVDTKSVADSLRNETTHLKAEKELWKSIEDRLSRDNESLMEQRAQLNASLSSLQSMQNERERSDAETRRRFQSQVENLENELQATKRRLNDEVEEGKKLMLRKEYESKEAQKRIDDVHAALATARENLVAAKAKEDHLQSKVDELSITLKATEEKLEHLQPAKKPEQTESTETGEDSASQEQELRLEITELNRQLELTKADLANAQTDAEKYREISQSSEDALQNLTDTYETYKAEMESSLEEKDAKIVDLEQRMTDITSELEAANQELTQLRQEQSEKERAHEEELKLKDSELASLKEEVNSQMAASRHHQENLKRQAQIAQDAQQSYETELMKHAQAAESLQKVRTEFAELKTQVYAFKSEAEAAKSALESSKASWDTQRDTYEKELQERQTRASELERQNKVLHSQFEGVSHQIAELQKNRDQADNEAELATSDKSLEELREVISYLRREKEIVEVQLELQVREAQRFKQQLDHTQKSLDEARLALNQERERENEALRAAGQHEELMQRISELNLLRESNTALRSEKDRQIKKVKELQAKIDEMNAKIQPMEEKIRGLEGEVEVKDGQMRLLQEDNDRWKARTNQILQKYDRIDPAELEALKEELRTVQEKLDQATGERDAAIAEKDDLIQKKEQEKTDVANSWRSKLDKIVTDTKQRLAERRKTIDENKATIDSLNTRIAELQQSLETASSERDQATKSASENQGLMEEKAKWDQERLSLIENAKRNEAEQNAKLESMAQEVSSLKMQLDQARQEITNLKAQLASASTSNAVPGINNPEEIEAEVNRRVAESQANIDSVVAERVASQLAAQQQQGGQATDPAALEAAVQERLATEKQKWDDEKKRLREAYQNSVRSNVAKAHENKNKEIEEIKKAKAEVESQLEEAKKSLENAATQAPAADPSATPASSSEEVAALQTQLREAQEKLSGLEEAHAKKVEELQQQIQTAATAQGAAAEAQSPGKISPAQQEQMKRIITRNVESRMLKEREKMEAELQEKIKEAEAAQVQQAETKLAELKEQYEKEMQEKEAEFNSKVEQAKESARKEGEMRSNVKISMMEKKNKQLTDKLKALEEKTGDQSAATPATTAPPTPQQPRPQSSAAQQTPQQQQQVSAFSQAPVSQTPANPVSAFAQPATTTTSQSTPQQQEQSQQQQSAGQPVSAFGLPQKPPGQAEQSQQQNPQATQESSTAHPGFNAGNVGTGPAALRNLRGQLHSGIPRGGAPGGRGGRGGQQQMIHGFQHQQPGGNAGQSQQQGTGQEAINQHGIPVSLLEQRQQRFGTNPPSNQPNQPQQQQQQQQQQQGQIPQPGSVQSAFGAPPSGLPRGGASGRGAFGRPSRGGAGARVSNVGVAPQSGIPVPGQAGAGRGSVLNAGAQQFNPAGGIPVPGGKRGRGEDDQGDEAAKRQKLPGEQ